MLVCFLLRVVLCGLGNRMLEWAGVGLLIACASLMPCAAYPSNVVDIFNATSGSWSTAALSVPRFSLSATSLPNLGVAIFAGGSLSGSVDSNVVDIFNVTSGAWSTAALSVARRNLAATSLPNLGVAIFAGGWRACCYVEHVLLCVRFASY
jgi:hypothetical protein